MQIISIASVITVIWMILGYSIAFTPVQESVLGTNPIYGNFDRVWFIGMTVNSRHQLAPDVPESLFCLFNLAFAIITPCLICGSFADRMAYVPMLLFIIIFHLLIYCPLAHSIWHPQGFLFKLGALDFAGGTIVHISSGMAGLMSSIVIGKRIRWGEERFQPHSILTTFTGVCMLWIG